MKYCDAIAAHFVIVCTRGCRALSRGWTRGWLYPVLPQQHDNCCQLGLGIRPGIVRYSPGRPGVVIVCSTSVLSWRLVLNIRAIRILQPTAFASHVCSCLDGRGDAMPGSLWKKSPYLREEIFFRHFTIEERSFRLITLTRVVCVFPRVLPVVRLHKHTGSIEL